MTAIRPASTYRVYIALGDGPLVVSPTWTNVSQWFMSISTNRGRSSELDDFQAGTCTVVLENRDRRFDPTHAAGPYFGNLLPRRQIKVEAVVGATTYPVFRGVIESYRQTWAFDDGQTCTIEASDVASLLARREFNSDALTAITGGTGCTAWWPLTGDTMNELGGTWPGTYVQRSEAGPLGYAPSSSKIENDGATSTRLASAPFRPGSFTKSTIACLVDAATPVELLRVQVDLGLGWEWVMRVTSDGYPEAFCSVAPTSPVTATATAPTALTSGVHHLAAVRDGDTVKIYVDGVLADSTTNASMTTAQTPLNVLVASASSSVVTLCTAAHAMVWNGTALTDAQVALLADAALTGRLGRTTSGMVSAVADLAGFPTGLRSIGTSSQGVGPFDPADAWTAMQTAARSDPGRLFVNRAGTLTFEPRTVDMGASATAAFADDATAGAIRFSGYELESTDRWVFNEVTVTGSGVEATVSDATSRAAYDTLTLTRATALPDAAACRAVAATLLEWYKQPAARGSGWVCDPVDDTQLAAVFAVELGDVVTVRRTPKVGSAHTSTVQITSISHSVEGVMGTVSFTGAPVDTTAAGVWGSGLWDTAKWG